MPTSEFFGAVSTRVGSALSPEERKFLTKLMYVNEFESASDSHEREETVSSATGIVRTLRDCYPATEPIDEDAQRLAGLNDGRWQLLTDLRSRRAADSGKSDFEPPKHLSIGQGVDITCYPVAHHLTITVDSGVPLKTLTSALRALWPQMRDKGYLRRTRAMADRSVALVRFVCLEQPLGATWRERLAAWNSIHPEWHYKDVRAFQKDFSRAEASIAGAPGGLDWFYDTDARELSAFRPGSSDLDTLSPGARKKLSERLNEFLNAPFWDYLNEEARKHERTSE